MKNYNPKNADQLLMQIDETCIDIEREDKHCFPNQGWQRSHQSKNPLLVNKGMPKVLMDLSEDKRLPQGDFYSFNPVGSIRKASPMPSSRKLIDIVNLKKINMKKETDETVLSKAKPAAVSHFLS